MGRHDQEKGKILSVAISGAEYTSIATALGAASSGDTVMIYPGTYTEAAMTVPANVSIKGIDQSRTIISASDTINPLFTVGSNVKISDLTLQGVTSHACIYDNSGVKTNIFSNLTLKTSQEGIFATGANTRPTLRNINIESTVTRGIYETTSGTDNGIIVFSTTSEAVTSLQSDSGTIWLFSTQVNGGTNAVYANGGDIDFHGLDVLNTTNVLRVNNSGSIQGALLESHGTASTWDILQEDAGSSILITSGIINSDKISAANISNLLITFDDTKEGDEGLNVLKELHVGMAELGKEACIGEGDSYTRGMLVYTYNGSIYTDVSTAARSFSGSTFTFPGITANNAIYVASSLSDGSDVLKFLGIKSSMQTAAVLGAGEIVAEYWNGSSWTEFNHMSVDETFQHYPHAMEIFERTGFEQIRFNNNIKSDWTKNDPISPVLGVSYFWVRFRIKTAITTAPIFEQWKVHSNRVEHNADGWTEFFGNARPVGNISWDYNSFAAFGDSPGNQDLFVLNKANDYEDLGIGRIENSFADNVVSRAGLIKFSPLDLDTSSPLTLNISWVPRATGQMDWKVNFGIIRDGDPVATSEGAAATSITGELHLSTLATVGTINQRHYTSIDIDVCDVISRRASGGADELWITVARDGRVGNGNDTIGGAVDIIQIVPQYVKWSDGGHV